MQLKKILSNSVTRSALLYTLGIFIVFRIGSFVVTPGIDVAQLFNAGINLDNGLLGFYNIFGGGNFGNFSLFMLGVSPYITASIVIQLLENDLVPAINEWKHQGIDGQNKRSNMTKILAIIFAVFQSLGFVLIFSLGYGVVLLGGNPTIYDYFLVTIVITAGTAIMIWLADRITEKGIGNGISVLIMAGIVAGIPSTLTKINSIYFTDIATNQELLSNIILWAIILIIEILLVLVVIYFNLAKRKIKINYVRLSKGKLNENSYIPIKINPAGVIPIIFVTPIMLMPIVILNIVPAFSANGVGQIETIIRAMFDFSTTAEYWYIATVVYFTLIVIFSVFYSYIQMNPKNMTENLEKQGAYIVGVRSGEDTEKYLEKFIMSTSIWGGLILGFIAVIPLLISQIANIDPSINLSLLGTGLIITVSVLIQAYEGLLNKTQTNEYRKLFGEDK